ncbi:AzlD family protein [Halomonas urumqiensis]|uniref:Branched-chain amino acid transporter n=1 Tax=Halomonas urumqiensis TaxID=1684789 RepID=A0A2N7UJ72_9GAMM|nr:AzlD domain-containing protein [Halomonas urumqiensis]PMR80496.1 branched-chain amino acid transporter [Halomonas urumqiensis]PTB01659.1 AzlD domain-containing protein [Halomonas urumqiensis]GHE22255.1 branched-chain amino acid transporter [Halomonas urumqiensis]
MTLQASGGGIMLAIVIMALTTYLTRAGGVFVMARVPIGPRVERFINAMAGSVLVAVITPMAVNGDWGARMALVATVGVVLLVRKPLPAITAGILTAALWRLVFQG